MKELVSFITCGFLGNEFTKDLGLALREAGSDRLELGIPFSDPVADGSLIEKAGQEALKAGFKRSDAFEVANTLSAHMPLYFMGYFNSFFSGGFDNFCQKAQDAGARGLIIPDLPFEESRKYTDIAHKHSLSNITWLAVTHSDDRVAKIASASEDFIYLVAFAGITGADKSEDLSGILASVRKYTDTKVFVGFGVNENTAKDRAKGADGVIVGSAFTKILLEEGLNNAQKIAKCAELARTIKAKINE